MWYLKYHPYLRLDEGMDADPAYVSYLALSGMFMMIAMGILAGARFKPG